MLNQNKMPIVEALEAHAKNSNISFHVPGHKENFIFGDSCFCEDIKRIFVYDVTELEGLDDFHAPDGIIIEAQKLAANLYGAEESFFLVNGTTSGIMAAVASAAGEGQNILVADNCHLSVTRGLIFSGAFPIYIKPDFDIEKLIYGAVSLEKLESLLTIHTSIKAILLTHPSYYGTYSDLKRICEYAHSKGIAVIADEAHGAQLQFLQQRGISSALSCGADIVIQSTHKMIGSMTQSSMLHVQGNMIDRNKLRRFISMFTSTSPSYLLMASLDTVRHEMAINGIKHWNKIFDITKAASEKINQIEGLYCLKSFIDNGEEKILEGCRLVISASKCGLSGHELLKLLSNNYGIDAEFSDELYIILLSGYGTVQSDMDILIKALTEISLKYYNSDRKKAKFDIELIKQAANFQHHMVMSPRKAVMSKCEFTELKYASGMVAAEAVSVYPPGIPILQPGEEITEELIKHIETCIASGLHLHGLIERRVAEDDVYGLLTAESQELQAIFGMVI